MAREKRSAEELAHLLIQHVGIEGLSITVLADNVYGWNGFAMTAPETEPDIHAKMQWAVEELRTKYELTDVIPNRGS